MTDTVFPTGFSVGSATRASTVLADNGTANVSLTVASILGQVALADLPATGATTGQAILFNGTTWAPGGIAGGVSLAVAGTDPVPGAPGTAAVGTSAKAAREDHVHPLPASLPLANLSSGGGSNGQGLVLSGGVWTPTTLANGTTYTGSAPINVSGSVVALTGIVPIANGGTGTTTPGLIAGTNVTVSGAWPNQTVNASAGGYTLPTATTTILGGVKVDGSSIVISNGVISASASGAFAPTSVLRTFDNGAVVSAGTLYFIGSSPWAGNILSLDSKCGVGSYTVAIQINGVTVTGLGAVNVSGSTVVNTAATGSFAFPAGAVITAVVSTPTGSPTDSFLNLRIQRTA